MYREPVDSSSLASVGYDDAMGVLEAEFHNGGIYRYFAVPLSRYRRLMASVSKGQFFNAHIRDAFPHERVT